MDNQQKIKKKVKNVLIEFFNLRKNIDDIQDEQFYQPILDEEDIDIISEAIAEKLVKELK